MDEIQHHVDGRYVSACEAAWRVFAFPLHKAFPNVVRLPVHLEGEQQVRFAAGDAPEAIANRPLPRTPLTAYFALQTDLRAAAAAADVHAAAMAAAALAAVAAGAAGRRVGQAARLAGRAAAAAEAAEAAHAAAVAYTYQDVCDGYTWQAQPKEWRKRKNKCAKPVGRLYMCSPAAGERYYLRLLLTHVRGPASFLALRTVEGTVHATYKAAAVHLGLLADAGVWDEALRDAAVVRMPAQLRAMFAAMLLFDPPAGSAQELWDRHQLALAEDVLRAARRAARNPDLQLTADMVEEALRHLQRMVEDAGTTMAAVGMREPGPAAAGYAGAHAHPGGRLARDHLGSDPAALQQRVRAQVPTLNADQRAVHAAVMEAVRQGVRGLHGHGGARASNAFFVDSPGGCGKTYLFNLLLAEVRAQGDVALAVASSGIAALLLDHGRTAHSMFKIPIPILADSHCRVDAHGALAQLLRAAVAVVWDEAPMMHRWCFEAVDRLLRDLVQVAAPFGGKVVVLGGDFRQVLPVVRRGTRAAVVAASLPQSHLWRHLSHMRLSTNMRVARLRRDGQGAGEQQAFAACLLAVGEGRAGDPFCIPPSMRALTQHPKDLIHTVLGDLGGSDAAAAEARSTARLTTRALLTPRNEDVDALNDQVLASFPGTG